MTHVEGAVVPGHGDVGDASFVAAQLADLNEIVRLARAIQAREVGLEDAIARAPFPPASAREPLERALAQLRGDLPDA